MTGASLERGVMEWLEVEGERKSGARRAEMMRRFRVIGNDIAKLRFIRMGIPENLTVTFPLYVTLRRTDGVGTVICQFC